MKAYVAFIVRSEISVEKGDYALFHQWAFHSLLPLATKLTPYFHLSAVAQQNSR
jgi:hypothetical protein